MKNLREVKDDLLKEWIEFRGETAFCEMTPQDKKYCIYFDEIAEKILKNVPEQNKKYVQNQLDQLDKNFMDYLYYWNEKYYRNGFADVIELFYSLYLGFPGGLVVKNLPPNSEDTEDMGSFPESERSPGEGNGNPLQYSCLGNPMDRGAWQAPLHGATASDTPERLSATSR